MSDASGQMCLVQRSAPSTPAGAVESRQREALVHFFQNPEPSVFLLRFLEDLHSSGRWIVCDCLGPEVTLNERPTLTIAKSPKGKLFLRNLQARKLHGGHCPFRYEPGKRPDTITEEIEAAPSSGVTPGKPLNLHVVPGLQVGAPSAPGKDRDLVVRRQQAEAYPRLGQVLLYLMREAQMLSMESEFDFLQGIKDMRAAAEGLMAYAGTSLNDMLAVSCRHEESLIKKVKFERETRRNAYGLMVVVVHKVSKDPLTLLRFTRDRKLEWKVSPRGEVKVWSRRSINKGPFLAAITYAPSAGDDTPVAQNAFLLPIVDNQAPLPVESDFERTVAKSLLRLASWHRKKSAGGIVLEKPMENIKTRAGECRPDFVVRGPGGKVVVEVMGMAGQEAYDERKSRTVPIMREVGEVLEVTPFSRDGEKAKEELQSMNRWVLARVGKMSDRPSGPRPKFQEI